VSGPLDRRTYAVTAVFIGKHLVCSIVNVVTVRLSD
jgi:hypothetical protein